MPSIERQIEEILGCNPADLKLLSDELLVERLKDIYDFEKNLRDNAALIEPDNIIATASDSEANLTFNKGASAKIKKSAKKIKSKADLDNFKDALSALEREIAGDK